MQWTADPGFIRSMAQLSTLSLQGPLCAAARQQQQQAGDGAEAMAAAGSMQALVEALPGLTELEALFICNTSKRDAGPLPASQVGK